MKKAPYRILVTGSRNWTDKPTIRHAIFQTWQNAGSPRDTILVSGNAKRGADRYAEICGDGFGFEVERIPANWDEEGKSAGPKRNQRMVNLGADICLAFPLEDSIGTIDCIKKAKKAKIPVHIYEEFAKIKDDSDALSYTVG